MKGRAGSKAFQIKWRRVFFFGAAFFLHKTLGQSQIYGCVDYFAIFIRGDPAVELRVVAAVITGVYWLRILKRYCPFGSVS